MSVSIPNGAIIEIASGYGTSKTMTSITNANPAVGTFTAGHLIAAGDFIEVTSGWSRLNNKIVKAGTPSTDNIPLLGINSSNVISYPASGGAGSAREITGWTVLDQILNASSSGGSQQFLEYQFLGSDMKTRLPTVKEAAGLTLSIADDDTLAGYILASAADEDRLPRAVRMTLPSGAIILYNAYISLNKTPSLTVNEIMSCEVTLSFLAEPVRYAA